MKYFLVGLVAVLLLTGCTAHELPKEQLIVVGEKVEESDLNSVPTEAPVVTELPVVTGEPTEAPMIIEVPQVTESPQETALTSCRTATNPYNAAYYQAGKSLSTCVLDAMVESTGCKRQNVWETDTMSGSDDYAN